MNIESMEDLANAAANYAELEGATKAGATSLVYVLAKMRNDMTWMKGIGIAMFSLMTGAMTFMINVMLQILDKV